MYSGPKHWILAQTCLGIHGLNVPTVAAVDWTVKGCAVAPRLFRRTREHLLLDRISRRRRTSPSARSSVDISLSLLFCLSTWSCSALRNRASLKEAASGDTLTVIIVFQIALYAAFHSAWFQTGSHTKAQEDVPQCHHVIGAGVCARHAAARV